MGGARLSPFSCVRIRDGVEVVRSVRREARGKVAPHYIPLVYGDSLLSALQILRKVSSKYLPQSIGLHRFRQIVIEPVRYIFFTQARP